MAKTSLADIHSDRVFDLKLLFLADSGAGKTHFTGTYTKGPIHYYMFDPGGEKTLQKPCFDHKNITMDKFVDRDLKKPIAFDNFWKQLQQDEKEGFFDDLAAKNGILVFDSATTISQAVKDKIGKANNWPSKWEFKHWGQVTSILTEFIRVINSLPCAVVLTAHLKEDRNSEGNIIKYMPLMVGQIANTIGVYFSEYWFFKRINGKTTIHFSGTTVNPASSRIIDIPKATDLTFDDVYDLYMDGKAIQEKKGGTK